MTMRRRGFGMGMWVALTTAGVVTATLIGRQRQRRRVIDEQLDETLFSPHATQAEVVVDETLEESFPASDPPSWSGSRAR